MSTVHTDISLPLLDGIYTVLNNAVTVNAVTYPVYLSVPKTPASIYVFAGQVLQTEDGTKEDFIYNGTIQIRVTVGDLTRPERKLAQQISDKVRSLLKTTKGGVFSISPRTMVVFKLESSHELIEQNDNGVARVNLIDIYSFIIQ